MAVVVEKRRKTDTTTTITILGQLSEIIRKSGTVVSCLFLSVRIQSNPAAQNPTRISRVVFLLEVAVARPLLRAEDRRLLKPALL